MPFPAALILGYTAVRSLVAVARASPHMKRAYRTTKRHSKILQLASSGPFGYMYAGGTVLGYHDISGLYEKKWTYLGSPQRVKKL
tara:strand:+ start:165 stop:419 length:255 start_codon:yes stop_codon:yes gene_type:complete